MALLKLENLHVALEDGTEIVKGVDLEVDTNEVHAIMGPNGSGKSTLAYALMGHPAYEITEGRLFFDGEDVTELGADERAQRGLFLAFQYPHAIPGVTVTSFLRSAINAVRKARNGRRRRPDRDPRVPQGAPRPDGPAQGEPRARVALPQRRLLGRREEAGRDPADGDAEAAHRGARRDRLRPRHRRAAGGGERRERARRPRDGRARDHALSADPELREARSTSTSSSAGVSWSPAARARREARGEGYDPFIPDSRTEA
jgi:ABC-type sugar transport system ATPase subunit